MSIIIGAFVLITRDFATMARPVTAEMNLTELEHAGFKNLILFTDRGYESMKNLKTCIAKGQKIISIVKVSQGEVLKIIKSLDMSRGFPKGMSVAPKEKLYYIQRDAEYNLNMYFNPFKRADAQVDICKAFGFDIPDGCAPTYTSRKKSLKPRRGRPTKPKVEHQEL